MRFIALDTPKPLSKIGLGTWQFGSREWGYGPDFERQAAQIVRRAVELGVTVFDSAEIYGFGRSERILGAALGDDRPKVVIASKILPVLPVAAVVQQRAVASAARLGVTSIDLYQVHQPNPLVGDHATMRGMRTLQDVGLVGEVGVSNYGLRRWQVAEAALGRRVLSNQVRYSMLDRAPEQDLLPYARQAGRVVIAYSPLAQGFLSGRYDARNPPTGAVRRANPYFLPENLERGAALIDTLRQVADAHDATPSQIALAYLLRHPNVLAIPGASGVEQMERNAAAADIDLADDEYTALAETAKRFRPITGLAAMPAMLRARFGRPTGK
ncbi:aldo/keto reductase [Micromonospora sp. NPDC127501]|uniref:aldo/keto reductase n=1 Tax=Micromonospora sp. NPDC127501 TaxID=3154872 RepID=UPI00331F6267